MKLLYGCSMLRRRMKIETIYRNLDLAICWIKYLADEQDCRTRRKAPDCHL